MKEIRNIEGIFNTYIPENYDECITMFCDNCNFFDEHRKTVLDCKQYQKYKFEKFPENKIRFDLPV